MSVKFHRHRVLLPFSRSEIIYAVFLTALHFHPYSIILMLDTRQESSVVS